MALKRRHGGAEMATNDKPLKQNYDDDKKKMKSTATFAFQKLDSDLQRIPRIPAFYI